MLYNKDWDKPKVKADPFSLESLIAWLEKMPADSTYNWHDCDGHCLLAQYVTTFTPAADWAGAYFRFPTRIRYGVAAEEPYTFSAALTRAREALASRA